MRIMRQHQRLGMNLKSVSLSLLFLTVFSNHFFAKEFSDENYYRSGLELSLKSNHEFVCTDTSLTSFKNGTWSLVNSSKLLVLVNSKKEKEVFELIFKSENKITLKKEGKTYSYHDKESSDTDPPFSIYSIFPGTFFFTKPFVILNFA